VNSFRRIFRLFS